MWRRWAPVPPCPLRLPPAAAPCLPAGAGDAYAYLLAGLAGTWYWCGGAVAYVRTYWCDVRCAPGAAVVPAWSYGRS